MYHYCIHSPILALFEHFCYMCCKFFFSVPSIYFISFFIFSFKIYIGNPDCLKFFALWYFYELSIFLFNGCLCGCCHLLSCGCFLLCCLCLLCCSQISLRASTLIVSCSAGYIPCCASGILIIPLPCSFCSRSISDFISLLLCRFLNSSFSLRCGCCHLLAIICCGCSCNCLYSCICRLYCHYISCRRSYKGR